ncbi:MAG: glycerophosphodiester phosphodiesterase [Candidatus Binatia bacterium]
MKETRHYPFFTAEKPKVFGHRGAAGVAPENTLASFERALADGADFMELDLRESKDGELLIIHDATLERTTNGRGEIRKRELKELKSLDAGYWFTLDGGVTYCYRGQKIEIPTLEEFFSTFPQVRATIEIKQAGPGFVKKLVATVRRFGREDWVLLATEEDEVMREIRKEIRAHDLGLATGFSCGEVASFMHWVWEGRCGTFTPPGQALQIPCTYGARNLITEQTVRAAHDLGLEVHAWTINDAEEVKWLLSIGVDGIITDYPARVRELDARIASCRK